MIRRIVAAVVLTCVIGFLALSAELPAKWRSWRYSRAVLGLRAENSGAAELSLPWEVYAHCKPGCEDVRIVNSQNIETPYVMEGKQAPKNTESHSARIIENSFAAGHYTQVIGDLGEGQPIFYDRVRVETERPNFIVWAEVALSNDTYEWRIVEAHAPISRFHSRAIDGTQTIPFQGLSSRYIRVRIADPSEQFPVGGLTVLHEETYKFDTKEIQAAFAAVKSTDPEENVWRADLQTPNQPVSELQIGTDSEEFYRAVRVSASSDGQEWSYWASGIIYRYPHGDNKRESLNIEFPENAGCRFVRVEVINGNDQPLSNVHFALAAVPRTILMKLVAGERYKLIYGNEKASRPQYDLGHYLDFEPQKLGYLVLSLGPEEETANYRDPRPFTERHPELLWSALGAAILLIGLTAIKALRSTDQPAPRT